MPLVTVKVIEGVFTQEQKREMIKKITDTMVEIEGENLRPVTWVLVEEVTGVSRAMASRRPMCTLCRRSRLRPQWAEGRAR
jgi:4-oxalocrotonate tautomerase family enzyme